MTNQKLKVGVATPLSRELSELITSLEPRIELLYEPNLLPPMRWVSDHEGDPNFRRNKEEQARFEALLLEAEAYYGIPDTKPALLNKCVKLNEKLRWVHTMAAGGGAQIKAAKLEEAQLQRIAWTTSAGPHSTTLAEFVLFTILAGAKDLPRLQEQKRMRNWSGRWVMRELCDLKIVVVGLGAIGQACVQYLAKLGVQVIGVNRSEKTCEVLSEFYLSSDLLQAAQGANGIVNALPGTANTQGLISRQVLSVLSPRSIIASVGRGNAIDEEALIEMLESGHLGFAGLDVFAVEPLPKNSKLWELENVMIAPHTAALSHHEDERIARLFATNASRLLDGQPLINSVNTVEFY